MRLTRSGMDRDASVHRETGGRSREVLGFFITQHTRSAGPAGDMTRRRQMESGEWELRGVSDTVDQHSKMCHEVDRQSGGTSMQGKAGAPHAAIVHSEKKAKLYGRGVEGMGLR